MLRVVTAALGLTAGVPRGVGVVRTMGVRAKDAAPLVFDMTYCAN